jgi:hypothetical protein
MRKLWIYCGIFIIALIAAGCVTQTPIITPTPAPAPTPTSAPVAAIYIDGIVLDQNGTPVKNALVALWQGDWLVQAPENTQHSNDTGYFNFTNLQPAHYQITADLQGHQGVVDRRFNESASIRVTIPGFTASNVTPGPGQTSTAPRMPRFSVTRTGPTTVQVNLISFGGVTTLKGFYVKSPVITQQEVVQIGDPLGESWTAIITDPNLTGTVHFVASSWVNGNYAVVIDTTI